MLPGLSSRPLVGTSDKPGQCYYPRAKLRKVERRTKQTRLFFLPRRSKFDEVKVTKKHVTDKIFYQHLADNYIYETKSITNT